MEQLKRYPRLYKAITRAIEHKEPYIEGYDLECDETAANKLNKAVKAAGYHCELVKRAVTGYYYLNITLNYK